MAIKKQYNVKTSTGYEIFHFETSEDSIVDQVQQLTETGYRKLPGGMILQWGKVQPTSSSAGEASQQVILPIQFPSTCVGAFASVNDIAGNHANIANYVCNAYGNNTAIVVRAKGAAGTKVTIKWFAIGY